MLITITAPLTRLPMWPCEDYIMIISCHKSITRFIYFGQDERTNSIHELPRANLLGALIIFWYQFLSARCCIADYRISIKDFKTLIVSLIIFFIFYDRSHSKEIEGSLPFHNLFFLFVSLIKQGGYIISLTRRIYTSAI